MSQKNYVGLTSLSTFLDKLKSMFALLVHKHTLSDITDYSVDSALSSTSTNPVQNSVINAELDAIAEAMQALDATIDEKSKVQMVEGGQSIYVPTLSIQKLTQAEYDQAFNNGTIDVNTIYLTPDEEIDFPVDSVNGKTGDVTLGASDVGAAPTSHAVSATTYGAGNGSNYGHVKLSDSTSSTSAASSGVAATPKAVKAAYDLATSASNSAADAIQRANDAAIYATDALTAANGKAPTSHASSATTYGIGTSNNYGHVKISDSTSSTSAASSGVAASPKAVKSAYDLANAAMPKSGGTFTGDVTIGGNVVRTAACSARGSASSVSLAASTVTQITLDSWQSRTDTSFTFSGGGIKCPYAGNVLISGNVYINNNDNSQRGCYIKKNGTEIITQYISGGTWAGGVSSGMTIISVAAGDVITLCARCSSNTTCQPNSGATILNIMYV